MSPTEKLYFHDTYLFESEGTVTHCSEEDGKHVVVLDKTILYPQGGGQPTDFGTLTGGDGSVFDVEMVTMDKATGVVSHKGTYREGSTPFSAGTHVQISVDEGRRRVNARLHSAGHLIDAAVIAAGRTDLKATKGNHFPDNLFVEYEGKIDAADREVLIGRLNEHLKSLIAQQSEVQVVLQPPADGMADPVRVVNVGGCECPCGGTHVKNLSDIVGVTVTKIKAAKKNVKVYYTIDGIEAPTA
eukprot:comp24263_c1_seq1/m.45105 comp24263_c1_seq1/g.45105  ORF comp24263_c1_seq1/g.45105 comp24263_c1_seq1/m.45105 type:complete len:243 (-) comp24263_c1_seq1:83-811(-)